MKTVKSLLEKTNDPYLALLSYRSTSPAWCGLSPAELLMSRKLHIDIPQHTQEVVPEWSYLPDFHKKDAAFKAKQKNHYDCRHRVKQMDPLPEDQSVWVRTNNQQIPGQVIQAANTPRSYLVETTAGQVRRNCLHLNVNQGLFKQTDENAKPNANNFEPLSCYTHSHTGTPIMPPNRLTYWRKGDVL